MELTLTNKLSNQLTNNQTSKLCVFDIDGTLYSAGWKIVEAPYYNMQTTQLLQKASIPFILITGREAWNQLFEKEMTLHGIGKADAVIAGAGTVILYRKENGILEKDNNWEKKLGATKVTWNIPGEKSFTTAWDHQRIQEYIKEYREQKHITMHLGHGNNYLIRITVENLPVPQLFEIKKDFETIWSKGVKIVYTEKLLKRNHATIFSGDILLIPPIAGKELAVTYLLEKLHSSLNTKYLILNTFLFGDASIDVPMLLLKDKPGIYTTKRYLVHPTPLARQALEEKNKTDKSLFIIEQQGPQAILQIMNSVISNEVRYLQRISRSTRNDKFSSAQNNPVRSIVNVFEPLLNTIIDKKLSANDISILGLQKVKQGVRLVQNKSIIDKLKGFYLYNFGNFTDVLDGIRARATEKTPDGQLVDGFVDRTKEFYQLYKRSTLRLGPNKTQTLLATLSCVLPSIARAQVEITGKSVSERDSAGGSMIDRTRLLSASLFFHAIGLDNKSFEIDKEIYRRNMATFENRKSTLTTSFKLPTQKEELTNFQSQALERFLFYVEILQKEYTIISKKYSLKDETEFLKIIKPYLQLKVAHLRNLYKIPTYNLETSLEEDFLD